MNTSASDTARRATSSPGHSDGADLNPRLLPLTGTFNARDVGGYVATGGTTAWGRLIRAAGLDAISDADRAVLTGLGVRTIVDLRRDEERAQRPNALGELDVRTVHISIMSGAPSTVLARVPDLAEIYREIVESSGAALAGAVSALAEPGALPAVVHCTAGKDRTGVVIAVTLALLGVDDGDVVADYAASAGLLGAAFVDRLAGGDTVLVERLAPLTASPPELLADVLARVRSRHGSVERYLLDHGMDPSVPGRLRAALVERDD